MMGHTKNKAGQKSGKVKLGKLKLHKETVKDLSNKEAKKVKGGVVRALTRAVEAGCP